MMTAVQWKDPDYEMPPKENDRLTEEQISTLRDWIDAGAAWPDEETQRAIKAAEAERLVTDDGIIVKTSGGFQMNGIFAGISRKIFGLTEPSTRQPLLFQGTQWIILSMQNFELMELNRLPRQTLGF